MHCREQREAAVYRRRFSRNWLGQRRRTTVRRMRHTLRSSCLLSSEASLKIELLRAWSQLAPKPARERQPLPRRLAELALRKQRALAPTEWLSMPSAALVVECVLAAPLSVLAPASQR